ncbi:MAG TPA: hypothetical protein VK558_07270 [Patescibacteria group bacterium]|nr:hypothetical protein [Patescibacteria group bacterium]
MQQANWGWVIAAAVVGQCMRRLQDQRKRHRVELSQSPALGREGVTLTSLDKIVLEIARHEALASRYDSRRPLFRANPLEDETAEGGWDFFLEDWGKEIFDAYTRTFPEIREMKQSKRERRLLLAVEKSRAARAECAKLYITSPHGEFRAIPGWMLISAHESDEVVIPPVWV